VICSTLKHARNVFAFTEQGVAMLSTVLNSPRAVQVNVEIMRAFTRLREVMAPIIIYAIRFVASSGRTWANRRQPARPRCRA
jgi:hypothetical protein